MKIQQNSPDINSWAVVYIARNPISASIKGRNRASKKYQELSVKYKIN
jgi:hypothetical protein